MTKRLAVLVAALAVALVLAPTSSAQVPGSPPECQSPDSPEAFEACLGAISDQIQSGGGGGGGPEECQNIQTQQDFQACLAALAEMAGAPSQCQTLIENGPPMDQAGFEQAGEQLQACLNALTMMDGGDGGGGSGSFDDCRTDSPGREGFFEQCPTDDNGTTPVGGVDSGRADVGQASSGPPLAAMGGGLALLAVIGAGAGLAVRRRPHS